MKYSSICFLIATILISACATSPKVDPVRSVEIRKVEVSKPAPIVPAVDQLKMRPVTWVILTPDNIEQKLKEIKNGEAVFFALDAEGYKNLSLNLNDIRTNIEQHKRIIAIYEKSF